ncbi:hypothetical protein Poly51_58120 [Rubripirellula tenax]|uniref:Uncharacterized protein n=1 Tax=Rubripirellula tenax TaxID=2528015 RepID=A0A5C6EB75_9BACT|nr:hypothetical protein [Rubripirellula tenax]TWU44746.1 hypothetical protein Poly51_58120 [Rubripirellula tenax]
MKTDLPERTFAFAKRIVKLCQSLEEHAAVAQTLSRQLISNLRDAIERLIGRGQFTAKFAEQLCDRLFQNGRAE